MFQNSWDLQDQIIRILAIIYGFDRIKPEIEWEDHKGTC